MEYFKTVSGKEFNPRDLISFLKTKYMNDPRKYNQKTGFAGAGDAIRNTFGVTDYGSDQTLDPNFDYNKFDWGDVSNTINSWATSTDPKLQALAKTLSPYMAGSENDRGIYALSELQNQSANIQAKGELDADEAQWNAVLNGDMSEHTRAFLETNRELAISTLTKQTALMKEKLEAQTASGRAEIEADYAGVIEEITAGVGKLQAMTVDEYAARGMAFSGTLNRANADIASAGATEIAKAMAQKGARLGKLVNDMVAYTAQIDIDTLGKQADIVAEYGLQMAALLDKDAQTRNDAEAALAAIASRKATLNKVMPINEAASRLETEQNYEVAKSKAQEDAEAMRYERNKDAAQLEAQYGVIIDPQTGVKLGTRLTPLQEWNMKHDKALLYAMYGVTVTENKDGSWSITDELSDAESVAQQNADSATLRAQTDAANTGSSAKDTNMGGWTFASAKSYIDGIEQLKATVNATPVGAQIDVSTLSEGSLALLAAQGAGSTKWTKESLETYLNSPNIKGLVAGAQNRLLRQKGMSADNEYLPHEVREVIQSMVEDGTPLTSKNYEAYVEDYLQSQGGTEYYGQLENSNPNAAGTQTLRDNLMRYAGAGWLGVRSG